MHRKTATHEAGHAVGRLLTARAMGYHPSEAVDHIAAGAVCYGPLGSKTLCDDFQPRFLASDRSEGAMWELLALSGTKGDRVVSMLCRMLFITMGAAAEAKLARLQDPRPIWELPACTYDRNDFSNSRKILSMTAPGVGSGDGTYAFLSHATSIVHRPEPWAAINTIAFALRGSATDMPGQRVAELAEPCLAGFEPDIFPSGWSPQ